MSQRQVLGIPFAGGIDDKTSEPWLQPGQQHRMVQNGNFSLTGEISKRRGMTALATGLVGATLGAGFTHCSRLTTFKSELDLLDGDALYAYSPTAQGWSKKSVVPACVASRQSVAQSSTYPFPCDVAEGSGYRVTVWYSASGVFTFGNVFVTVVDLSDGTTLYQGFQLTGSNADYYNARVFVLNGVAVVVYAEGTGSIFGRTLNLSTLGSAGWTSEATLFTDGRNTAGGTQTPTVFDAAAIIGDPGFNFVIAYETTASKVKIARVSPALAAGTTGLVSDPNVNPTCISVRSVFNGTTWVGYSWFSSPHNMVSITSFATSTLVQAGSPVTVHASTITVDQAFSITVEQVSTNQVVVAWSSFLAVAGVNQFRTYWQQVNTSSFALVGPQRTGFHVILASKAWSFAGRTYAIVFFVSTQQPTYYVVELGLSTAAALVTPRPVATVAPRISGAGGSSLLTNLVGLLAGVSNQGNTSATTFTGTVVLGASNDAGLASIALIVTDFANTTLYQPGEVGDTTHLSAGAPQFYDGQAAAEIGFAYYPELSSAFVTQASGGTFSNGTYQYTAVYEWIDSYGQIHRSAPSIPVTVIVTGSSNDAITIGVPSLCLTNRVGDVKLVLYRTPAGGTVFYRSTTFQLSSANDQTVFMVSVIDTNSNDSILQSNPLLYDTGGVLDNVCPPSSQGLCIFKDRVWLIGDDGKTLWYSKSQSTGEAIAFSDALTLTVDEAGAITAIATMDDKLIIFKRDRIFLVEGDGPADTGAGSDLTQPQRVASDVGCIEARSVVLTPMGLLFQAAAGIYLLSRALDVSFFGRAVITTLASVPVITSAVLVPADNVVIFTCLPSAGSTEGTSIVYDYVQQAWGTYAYDLAGVGSSYGFATAVLAPSSSGGLYTAATATVSSAAGVLQQRVPGDSLEFFDGTNTNGQWITLQLETAWFKLAGMMGYKRVRGVQVSAAPLDLHALTIDIGTDFDDSWAQSFTYTSADIVNLDREELEVRLQTARCEAVRFRITDSQPSSGPIGSGQGPALKGLAIEWVAHQGLDRRPAAARN